MPAESLSRRERQIMDIVYRRGSATVADLVRELPEPPTDGAVRTMLKILEGKGQLARVVEDGRAVYSPAAPKGVVSAGMLDHVVRTFFDGSAGRAMSRLLKTVRASDLTDDDLARLAALVDDARRRKGDA